MPAVIADASWACLGCPARIFAIGAADGHPQQLRLLHDYILHTIVAGEKIVYLGDYINPHDGLSILDEMLRFRTQLLMQPGMEANDFIYVRGILEETWERLLRLSFVAQPALMLQSLLDEGAAYYVSAYGMAAADGVRAVRSGLPAISRWTQQLRAAQRNHGGHEALMSLMRRGAYTTAHNPLLFVPCGFDLQRSLAQQGDALWSADSGIETCTTTPHAYQRIIRGRNLANTPTELSLSNTPAKLGLANTPASLGNDSALLTLDNGNGMEALLCAIMLPNGQTERILQIPRAYG
jgi:serine/threonine protein phosphatase 1